MNDRVDVPAGDADDVEALQRLGQKRDTIVGEIRKIIVGMDEVIDEMMIAIFSNGHCLLVGVPGLAKTLLVSSLAQALSLSFKRIQFTPDLMPSDITGTEVLQDDPQTRERRFKFLKGPIFANLILADEINRTPPKTQAALLEAMQERKISSGGDDYKLDPPFFVLATQNPIEQEGTYPLPEAQLDRFLFNILVRYPSKSDEIEIAKRVTGGTEITLREVMGRDEILQMQKIVRRIPVAQHMYEYAATIARATRPQEPDAPDFIRKWIAWGAGPRATLNMILAGKARAALRGHGHVAIQDIQAVAPPVLRHRIIPNFSARSEGRTTDHIIEQLLQTIPADEKLYDTAGVTP
ncbi:MAG: AAA family ATPase [Phycisphaeraceae bacterium]